MMLLAYFLFVAATFPLLFGKDRLFGIIYALLFVYSFFALLGYMYMPGYSESLSAYFGEDVGRIGLNFIFASMACIFLINMVIYKNAVTGSVVNKTGISVDIAGNSIGPVLMWGVLIAFIAATAINFNQLSWYIAELDEVPVSLSLYILLFKMSSGVIIFLYGVIRMNLVSNSKSFILPVILYAVAFMVAAAKLGNRTDPAALIIGIIYFETARSKVNFKTIILAFSIVVAAATILTVVEMTRYNGAYVSMPLSERIIKNDYFAPAHVLLGAIAYNFVDPLEVVRSNFSNALVKMEYPFLQKPVMDLFAPGVASRSASYAFYVFTEGFMFMGLWGFIYNGVVISFFVRFWNMLGCTSDNRMNIIIRSVLATMAINVVRGQSAYFVKYLYTFFLPVMVIGIVLIGVRLRPVIRTVRQ